MSYLLLQPLVRSLTWRLCILAFAQGFASPSLPLSSLLCPASLFHVAVLISRTYAAFFCFRRLKAKDTIRNERGKDSGIVKVSTEDEQESLGAQGKYAIILGALLVLSRSIGREKNSEVYLWHPQDERCFVTTPHAAVVKGK